MRSIHYSIITTLAYGSFVIAAPAGGCSPIDAVYVILKGALQAQASSLCLSYLGGDKTVQEIQTRTVTGLGKTITVIQPDQIQTANVEITSANQVVRTAMVYEPNPTQTQYVTVTAATRTVHQKRDTEAEAAPDLGVRAVIPSQLALFASSRISSACSCIATPVTRTIIATQIETVAGPQATQLQAGKIITVTVTKTIQITSEDVITKTLPPTGVVVQTIATTLTPILVKPKICSAKGLPGANAFNYDADFTTNQADCIAGCKSDSRCLSTGFYIVTDPSNGSQTGTCRRYDKVVADSADLGFGYYTWNDKAC